MTTTQPPRLPDSWSAEPPPSPPEPATVRIPGRVIRLPKDRVSLRLDLRTTTVGLVVTALILSVGVVTLGTGDFDIPIGDVVTTLLGGGTRATEFIVLTLRLPRLLTALLVGAALGVAGAIFQSVSRNPLGSPDIIGLDTGAATGAVLAILVIGGGAVSIPLAAIVGGVATALAVYLLAFKRGVQGYRLVLVGIGIAAMLTSVNSYLLTRAEVTEAQAAAVWMTGSLNGRGWEHVVPVGIALGVLMPVALSMGRKMRMLEMGDDAAKALGVSVEKTRLTLILVGVGISATATASAGPIIFVALAAPQLARRLTRAPGVGLASSALMGAFLLSLSDLAAMRLFAPTQLPVGIMTGALGGVYLAWLLSREWRNGRG